MKKILLLSTVFISSIFIYTTTNAQFQASVNVNLQPEWGPSGYDYAENYYLPDVEAYYNVPSRQFVYNDRGNWVYASSLPGRCSNYDLYNGYKVVINERNPWFHFNNHRSLYAGYRFRHDQLVIRDYRSRNGYGRPVYDDRNRGNYGFRGDNGRRQEGYYDRRDNRGRDDDRRDAFNNNRRNNDGHGRHDRGRW